MAKSRSKENQGLPLRWQLTHGAYYYRVPPGLEAQWDNKKMFRLGSKLSEAYKVWATRLGQTDDPKTIGQLLDRYTLEIIPTKAAASQRSNQGQLRRSILHGACISNLGASVSSIVKIDGICYSLLSPSKTY